VDSGYDVFCGIDVGKTGHHAVGLDATGKRLLDKPLPNDETQLREIFGRLAASGQLLIVVDQPNTIGALPVAVARACGHHIAYLPGLSMRRIADLYPGQTKTDARDAFIIADAAHTLRSVDTGDDTLTELGVLIGFDDDLAGEATRTSNRIRGLLTSIHPALERVLGPRVAHPAVLEILSRFGGPAGIAKAGRRKVAATAVKHAPRMGSRLVDDIFTALGEQTVLVPGSTAAETVLPRLAGSLKTVLRQRDELASEAERMLDAHPLSRILTSMPGIGVRTRPNPARSRRRIGFPQCRPPGCLRRNRAHHHQVRDLHQRRAPGTVRQPQAQTGVVPVCVRRPARPRQQGVLQAQTLRR